MAPPDGTADRRARGESAAVLLVVLAVGGAALLSGDGGSAAGRDRRDTAEDRQTPPRTTREAPVLRGVEALPAARRGQLGGTLLLGRGDCRTVTLDLARLDPGVDVPVGCPLAVSPSGRLTLFADGGSAQVVDVRRGRTLLGTPLRVDPRAPSTVAVDDEGRSASCEDGRIVLRPAVGTYRSAPGCEPVALRSGLHWLSDLSADGLPLVDAAGRPRRFRAAVVRETGPPYRLAASPGGRFLGVIAFHPSLGRHVMVIRVEDGHIVGRRTVDPIVEPVDLRVAPDGTTAAVLVRTDDTPEGQAWFLLRLDRRTAPVRVIAGGYLADVAFAPDGSHLVVITQNRNAIVVLRPDSFAPIARLDADRWPAPREVTWVP